VYVVFLAGNYHTYDCIRRIFMVWYTYRVGQNRIYTPYMAVYSVIYLPKIPYIHRIYMVLAKPIYIPKCIPGIPKSIMCISMTLPLFLPLTCISMTSPLPVSTPNSCTVLVLKNRPAICCTSTGLKIGETERIMTVLSTRHVHPYIHTYANTSLHTFMKSTAFTHTYTHRDTHTLTHINTQSHDEQRTYSRSSLQNKTAMMRLDTTVMTPPTLVLV